MTHRCFPIFSFTQIISGHATCAWLPLRFAPGLDNYCGRLDDRRIRLPVCRRAVNRSQRAFGRLHIRMTGALGSTLALLLFLGTAVSVSEQSAKKPVKERTIHSAGGLGAPPSLPELYAMSP